MVSKIHLKMVMTTMEEKSESVEDPLKGNFTIILSILL